MKKQAATPIMAAEAKKLAAICICLCRHKAGFVLP